MNKINLQYEQHYSGIISYASEKLSTVEEKPIENPYEVSNKADLNSGPSISLTLREMDVVKCLLQGKTAKESARILLISSRTVERHLENIRTKLNCKNKFEIVNKVLKNSILTLPLNNQGSLNFIEGVQLSA